MVATPTTPARVSRRHKLLSMEQVQNSPNRLARFSGQSLLTFQDAAEFLAISEGTLRWLQRRGEGPNCVRFGKHVRFRRADLERFVAGGLHLAKR